MHAPRPDRVNVQVSIIVPHPPVVSTTSEVSGEGAIRVCGVAALAIGAGRWGAMLGGVGDGSQWSM